MLRDSAAIRNAAVGRGLGEKGTAAAAKGHTNHGSGVLLAGGPAPGLLPLALSAMRSAEQELSTSVCDRASSSS